MAKPASSPDNLKLQLANIRIVRRLKLVENSVKGADLLRQRRWQSAENSAMIWVL